MKKEIHLYQNPKVKLTSQNLSENVYTVDGKSWAAASLVQYCKEQGYPTFMLPLAGITLDSKPWSSMNNFRDFCDHVKRVNDASLDYPILLDEYGYICDGWHRLAKALTLGLTEIEAIRIEQMPSPDGYDIREERSERQ